MRAVGDRDAQSGRMRETGSAGARPLAGPGPRGRLRRLRPPGPRAVPRLPARLPSGSRPVRPTPCPEGLPPASRRGSTTACCGRDGGRAQGARRVPARPARSDVAARLAAAPVLDPSSTRRCSCRCRHAPAVVRARGHDPMLRVSRVAARRLRRRGAGRRRWPRLLEQHAPVSDQAGLGREQRAANLAGSMRVRPPSATAGPRGVPLSLVVCDDVADHGCHGSGGAADARGLRASRSGRWSRWRRPGGGRRRRRPDAPVRALPTS